MKTAELDDKYLTLSELFNAVGRQLERQGPMTRTNVTLVRCEEVGSAARAVFCFTDDLKKDL